VTDLTTAAAVQSYLGIPNTQDTSVISTLVTNASDFIQKYCARDFTTTGPYDEWYDGSGNDALFLRNFPVVSVTSVSINGVAVPPSTSPTVPGWFAGPYQVFYRLGIFCKGRMNVEVNYSGGYASVPAAIAQACIDMVAIKYKRRLNLEKQGEAIGQMSITFTNLDVSKQVLSTLDIYKRVATI
jgi:hypothetical protein